MLEYAPRDLDEGIEALGEEPVFRPILERAGMPRFRRRRNGFATLLHIILEQQVSIDAAAAMHRRLVGLCEPLAPGPCLARRRPRLAACRRRMHGPRRAPERAGAAGHRRSVAALALGRGLPLLAILPARARPRRPCAAV